MSIDNKRRSRIIQHAYWDRAIDPDEVVEILAGNRPPVGWLTPERILIRLLESVPWYDVPILRTWAIWLLTALNRPTGMALCFFIRAQRTRSGSGNRYSNGNQLLQMES